MGGSTRVSQPLGFGTESRWDSGWPRAGCAGTPPRPGWFFLDKIFGGRKVKAMKTILLILTVGLIVVSRQKVKAQTNINHKVGTNTSNVIASTNNFYSPSLRIWTNASSFFEFATKNPFNGKFPLVIELGNAGYIPAEMWLAHKYETHEDPTGMLGMLMEAGSREMSPNKRIPFAKVMHFPTQHIEMYEDSNPFDDAAASWYLKAAVIGNVEAQRKLGDYYSNYGRNYNEAVRWYGYAIEQGDKTSTRALASIYANGLGVPKDIPMAIQLFARNEEFYEISAICLANGLRIPTYMWWCVGNARERGSAPFSSANANLQFTPAEKDAGAKAAAAYLAQRYGSVTNTAPAIERVKK